MNEQTAEVAMETVAAAKVPGADSPIEAIREIQQGRIAQGATQGPGSRTLVCAVYLRGTEIQVDSRVPAEALQKVLGAAYMAARQRTHPDTPIAVPERSIIVP